MRWQGAGARYREANVAIPPRTLHVSRTSGTKYWPSCQTRSTAMKDEEQKKQSAADVTDAGKAPSRPDNAPKRIPGQSIDAEHARKEKDGHVDANGQGRLTHKK
jgi:hypothetical protein